MASTTTNLPDIPMVRAAFAPPFLDTFKKIGIPYHHYFHEVKIPTEMEVTPLMWIPEAPWWRLIERISHKEGIPDLGLQIARELPFYETASLAPVFKNCRNLYEVLNTFIEGLQLQSTHGVYQFVEIGKIIFFAEVGTSIADKEENQMRHHHLLGSIQLAQMALGLSWRPRTIYIRGPYNKTVEQSSLLGGEKIFFNAPFSAYSISRRDLCQPIATKNICLKKTTTLLEKATADFVENMKLIMAFQIQDSDFNIQTVSELSGTSIRTLQRRLREKGYSFSEIAALVKTETAKKLIDENRLSLAEISDRLGYSDYTKFSRAFKKLTQMTPREFRTHRFVS